MSKWSVEEHNVSHHRKMGLFELHVWPLEATDTYPYQAWATIPYDGSSNILPSSGKQKRRFGSLDEAKRWIEDAMREVCRAALSD